MNRTTHIIQAHRPFSRRSLLAGAGAGLLASAVRAEVHEPLAAVDPNTVQPANSLAHIAYGVDGPSSWETSFVFLCLDAVAATVQLLTYAPSGGALAVPVVGGTTASVHEFSVPAGGAVQVDLDRTASNGITTGWAGIIASGNVRGQGIFRSRITGRLDLEAVVPMVLRNQPACIIPFPTQPGAVLAMPFDNTGGYVTSVAFANTATAARTLDLEFLDQNGAQLFLAHETLGAHNQIAFETSSRYPAVSGRKGWMRVLNSVTDFSALGFRFNPGGAFTTWLPVLS
jgi:hypothetical protein